MEQRNVKYYRHIKVSSDVNASLNSGYRRVIWVIGLNLTQHSPPPIFALLLGLGPGLETAGKNLSASVLPFLGDMSTFWKKA